MIPGLIIGLSLWIGFLYFLVNPWLAGIAAVLVACVGVLSHFAYRRVRAETEDSGFAAATSLEDELVCRGPVPLDRHYEEVNERRAS